MKAACLLITVLLVAGCDESAPPAAAPAVQPLQPGTIDNGMYRHEGLGLSMPIPAGWFALPRAEVDHMARASLQEFELGDAKMQRDLNREALDRVYLFVVREHGPEAKVKFSAAMMAIAHRIGEGSRFHNAREYLEETRRTLARTTEMKVSDRIDPVQIGSSTFQHFDIKLQVADRLIRQDYYAILRKDQAVGFVLTHDQDAQRASMVQALQAMKFEN